MPVQDNNQTLHLFLQHNPYINPVFSFASRPYTYYFHINLGEKTPYKVVLDTLGADILKAFQLKPIAPDEVILTPGLIRFNH